MLYYINNVIIPSLGGENILMKDFVKKILEDKNKINLMMYEKIHNNTYIIDRTILNIG